MIKKDKTPKRKPRASVTGNGHEQLDSIAASLQALAKSQQETSDRLEELEHKKDAGGEAKLFIAQRVFDTDRAHLSEMTVIPLRSVSPYSLADMSASVLDPAIQCGQVTLGQIRRESVYRHLRSVRGNLLEKGHQQALEQAKQAEVEATEEWETGK